MNTLPEPRCNMEMFHLKYICFVLAILGTDLVHGRFINALPHGITLHNVIRTWDEAQSQCKIEGGILASPINEKLYDAMKNVIDVKNGTFYIGAKANHSSVYFVSVEGIPIENMTVAMINMSPQLDPLDGDCIAMNSNSMHVVPCWTRLPYMCLKYEETENVSLKIEHEHYRKGVEYTTKTNDIKKLNATNKCTREENYNIDITTQKAYRLYREPVEWDEAEKTCVADGAHLVIIENEVEAKVIADLYDFKDDDWLFIGLLENGTWTSVLGHSMSQLYNVWRSPPNPEMHCGALHKHVKIDALLCESLLPFVCQIQVLDLLN